MNRLAALLYLATLALLPWGGIVPFPWLHANAQWSDVLFALAALAWAADVVASRRWPRLRLVHAALGLYLGWAALSLLAADPRPASGPAKLLGLGMLVALMVVTSEMARRPGMPRAIGRTVAVTSLLTAVAAVVGVGLSLAGRITPLVGTCGDLLPGPLSRAQAGFPHPNLLASYCVFASGVVAWRGAGLSRRLRRVVQAALTVTVLLTFSRAILAFALAAAVRGASTARRRTLVRALAAVLLVAMVSLTVVHVTFSPARPWAPQLRPGPSPRVEATATSFETLGLHPLFGTGPGSSPGRRGGEAFDAHLTPLNVAATLGLPALLGLLLVPVALWRARRRPTDRALWGMLAGLALDGLAQDVEDFRHVWVAFGLADADAEDTAASRGPRAPGQDGRPQAGIGPREESSPSP
jgi:hypothetical protein